MRSVTGAEPAGPFAQWVTAPLTFGDAAQVRAHAHNNEPFVPFNSRSVRLRILEIGDVIRPGLSYSLRRPMVNKDRLAAPHDRHSLTELYGLKVDLHGGKGANVG